MHKGYLKIASLLGLLSIVLGAFAAHGLKKHISAENVTIFETGVRYQFYHVFALALAGVLFKEFPNKFIKAAGLLFCLGILFFSGSLYLLAYKELIVMNSLGVIGMLTPLGGVLFIAGWFCLAVAVWR